jgi:short subunit dehydrogenase-like uncharacterized protein
MDQTERRFTSLERRAHDLEKADRTLRVDLERTRRELQDAKAALWFVGLLGAGFFLRIEYGVQAVQHWTFLALVAGIVGGAVYLVYRGLRRLFVKAPVSNEPQI